MISCKHCKFFKRDGADREDGICVSFAPRPLALVQTSAEIEGSKYHVLWPRVFADEGCGEGVKAVQP